MHPPNPGTTDERERFRELQRKLVSHHSRFRADPTQPYTAVIVPSQSVDPAELAKIPGSVHYEQRALFNLMLLRHPRLKVVFVTSKPLDPLIVDYYLHQMRGVPGAHARRRLVMLDCDDGSTRPLTEKILERPRLLARIRAEIDDPEMAHVGVFTATPMERTLSVQLGIPLNACDPDLVDLGSKTGSRSAFREAGIELAPGVDGLRSVDELVTALSDCTAERPEVRRIVVELDHSFSGEGNALLDLPGGPLTPDAVRALLPKLRFEADLEWPEYAAQFDKMGGVFEEWIEGEGKVSPSVQLRISPAGETQVISTHDQLLGGPSGQIFIGATFPAAAGYRLAIQDQARRVGEVLAGKGVIGRFGVDFLVVPGTPDRIVAVEINLRQGGTTHPFNTMKFLTDGHYDEQTGTFLTAQGQERCYFATDSLSRPEWRGLMPVDLIDAMVLQGLHFRSDDTGVVFHLLGCLSEYGKLGCTAIAPTVTEARQSYDEAVALIDGLARER